MSNPEDLEEFEEQLRLLEEEKRRKEDEKEKEKAKSKTYVDDDGTTFEWDEDKKAYFPKLDEDFIVQYQQTNYGNDVQQQQDPTGSSHGYQEMYDRFYKDYEKYCQQFTSSSSEGETDQSAASAAATQMSYEEYYRYWYSQQIQSQAQTQPQATSQSKSGSTNKQAESNSKAEELKRKAQEPPSWFDADDSKNTNVYVSGLPVDITEEEYIELMSKYGIITIDTDTKKPKIKLYKDKDGNYKGDGLCCYLKIESVKLCLQLLSDYDLRGHKIAVQQAKFELKGEYNPALKKKKKVDQSKRKKPGQEKLLDWKPEALTGGRRRCERVVVLKNMFEPTLFEKDPTLILEYQRDLREECVRFGEVRKVMVYDLHPDGVATVTFKEAEAADVCIENFHGRFYGGRQLSASQWDGKTSYKIDETDEEREQRIKKWHEEIEKEEETSG